MHLVAQHGVSLIFSEAQCVTLNKLVSSDECHRCLLFSNKSQLRRRFRLRRKIRGARIAEMGRILTSVERRNREMRGVKFGIFASDLQYRWEPVLSQSRFLLHICCMMSLAMTITGLTSPSGSKSLEISDRIARFVLGTTSAKLAVKWK